MSKTTIYAAYDDGDMVAVGEVSNAFRGAMHVWTTLADRYLQTPLSSLFMDPDKMKVLWDLAEDPRLKPFERMVHVSTFDRAYCMRENMLAMADALYKFAAGTSVQDNLMAQAAYIRGAYGNGARVVAWCQTSVAANLEWESMKKDDDGECRPFNIDRDPFTGPEVVA